MTWRMMLFAGQQSFIRVRLRSLPLLLKFKLLQLPIKKESQIKHQKKLGLMKLQRLKNKLKIKLYCSQLVVFCCSWSEAMRLLALCSTLLSLSCPFLLVFK